MRDCEQIKLNIRLNPLRSAACAIRDTKCQNKSEDNQSQKQTLMHKTAALTYPNDNKKLRVVTGIFREVAFILFIMIQMLIYIPCCEISK